MFSVLVIGVELKREKRVSSINYLNKRCKSNSILIVATLCVWCVCV